MARGFGRCAQCGGSTADISETELPAGKEVVYKCDMCGWEVKVFEDK
jgi:DNA-directed RNA polymerase subunit RPC12/RpoP